MIVDVHSHAWEYPLHFSDDFREQARRARKGQDVDLTVTLDGYRAGCPDGQSVFTVVFGGKARLSGLWVNDDFVARYVAQDPKHLLGFLSVDPTVTDGGDRDLKRGHLELGLQGVKLMPMYAGFSPSEPRLRPLWRYCQQNNLPVLLHTGTTFVSQAPLRHTLPRLLDEVAIEFPNCRIIMAHLGHPYEGECIAVIRKHPNVYADISALHYRPWQLFHSLMLVQEYGVWDKLLFGTDYPFTTVNATLAGLRSLNSKFAGTGAELDSSELEKLISRDSLQILGIRNRAYQV